MRWLEGAEQRWLFSARLLLAEMISLRWLVVAEQRQSVSVLTWVKGLAQGA